MPNLLKLLLAIFVLSVLGIIVSTVASDRCTDEASVFLKKLQEGDTAAVVTQFGENTCHCQPRGGYLSYLKYESGENDNLAFLLNHPFKIGEMSVKQVPTIEKVQGSHLPWEKPESTEIDIPIRFERASYSPLFLPLDMAFGHPIKLSELESFCKDPSNDFSRDLVLRLRPTLAKGLIPPAPAADPNRKPEYIADLYKELLPVEEAKYIKPTDASDIIGIDGKVLAASNYENILPHLKRGVLKLYVGRRGSFQRWAVRKGRLKDPVFELSNGKEIALTSPDAAMMDVPGHILGGPSENEPAIHE